MSVVNLEEKFSLFKEQWTPKIVAACNGQHVKIARIEGSFVWHKHEVDELFLVIKGSIALHLPNDEVVHLNEGEIYVVPAGVEHKPVAEHEAQILMIEPEGTLNTGDASEEHLKVAEPEMI